MRLNIAGRARTIAATFRRLIMSQMQASMSNDVQPAYNVVNHNVIKSLLQLGSNLAVGVH